MPETAALIGIDIGTSGAKAVLVDESGKIVASAFSAYPLFLPQAGWAEQDPEHWVQATIATIRQLLETSAIQPEFITGLAFSGQMHGLVCLDETDLVLRPAILWCDTRTTSQCRDIEQALGGPAGILHHTFNAALEGFTLPKLLWVRNYQPEIYAQIRTILLPKDYVRFRLTGNLNMDLSDAAGTLLLDVGRKEWSREVTAALHIDPSILPPLGESDTIAGHLCNSMATLTGLPEGLPIAFGGADNACAAVGTGVIAEGLTAVSIGTSGTVIAPVARPVHDREGRTHTFLHAVSGLWYVMGVMQAAGLSLKWFRDNFMMAEPVPQAAADNIYEILNAEAKAVQPGAEGLLWLPYLNGERTPHMNPAARGLLFGITARHTRGHIVRAIMEGVAFGLKDSLVLIEELGVAVNEIRLTGGGSRSRIWAQIISDVFQKPITTIDSDEGPALGAAILAGVATGVYPDYSTGAACSLRIKETFLPDPETASLYENAHQQYSRLYKALEPEFFTSS